MGKRASFDEVITAFYEAATDAALWRPALASMASLFERSFAAHTFLWDHARNVGFSDVDREELAASNEDYAKYYSKIDPRAAMIMPKPVGWILACHHYFDDRYAAKSEFYQDFMIKIGGRYIAAMKLTETGQHTAIISIHRSTRQGPFEDADLKLLQRLQPHLSRAASLFHRFEDLRLAKERSAAALDHFPLGVIVAARDARILDLNGAAEVHLRHGDALRSRSGRIEAFSHERTSALHRMIADAVAAAGGANCMPGGVLRLNQPLGEGFLTVLVAPLRQSRQRITTMAQPAAILFIADSENQPKLPAAWLCQIYGLTPAESVVALALAAGKSLSEIADTNGVARNTVRAQTQSILDKTGARRQAELVAILSRIPAIR